MLRLLHSEVRAAGAAFLAISVAMKGDETKILIPQCYEDKWAMKIYGLNIFIYEDVWWYSKDPHEANLGYEDIWIEFWIPQCYAIKMCDGSNFG